MRQFDRFNFPDYSEFMEGEASSSLKILLFTFVLVMVGALSFLIKKTLADSYDDGFASVPIKHKSAVETNL